MPSEASRAADSPPSAPQAASSSVGDLTERELIARIQSRLPAAPEWLTVGIGDDAAVIEPPRNRLEVVTVDALVEGVHFDRSFVPAEAIGHRALAVNLSDLAAMGAEPRAALLSLMLPGTLSSADFDSLIGGVAALASRSGIHVIGGNLTRSPGPLIVDVTVTGLVKRRQVLTRSGARAGDEVYVTGSIGGAAAGLLMLKQKSPAASPGCADRYRWPEPRLRAGQLLSRNRAASACMDLSDGLADAVQQIATASGVGMLIDAAALPIEADAREWFVKSGVDPVIAAATGGDDYELLFTSKPRLSGRLQAVRRHSGTAITRIGICTSTPGVRIRNADGTEAPVPAGFSHFR